jgi:hypothetical protein
VRYFRNRCNEHQVVASFSIALRHDSANEIDAS